MKLRTQPRTITPASTRLFNPNLLPRRLRHSPVRRFSPFSDSDSVRLVPDDRYESRRPL